MQPEYRIVRLNEVGLEGRNNSAHRRDPSPRAGPGLNEVRPRRPEQFITLAARLLAESMVSMKSGLEGRNNVR